MVRHRFFALAASAVALFFSLTAAFASELTWSPDGTGGTGGTGTWNTSALDWYPGSGPFNVAWTNGDTAVFGGTAGTVTLGSNGLVANSLQFDSSGYTINGNGNTLNLTGSASIGGSNTAINATLGGNAPLNVTGSLTLGNGGNLDQLFVTSGSTILNGGTLTLSDTGAPLTVGGSASAQLTIQNATVANALGTTTQVDGPGGTSLTVSGAGSQLTTGSQMLVGNNASGSLAVQNGAAVNNTGALILGNNSGAAGTLNIQSAGTVVSGQGVLGANAQSTGDATVTGAGSSWKLGSLSIGGNQTQGGTGTLNVTSGGAVTVVPGGSTTLYANGSIVINGGTLTTGSLISSAGASSINLTDPAGGAALTINGASGTSGYVGTITGTGSLVKNGGGIQILSNANDTFSGTTTINGGQLVVETGVELQNSRVVLNVDNGLSLSLAQSAVLGGLAGTGALSFGTTNLTVGGGNSTNTYSGALTGTGNFAMTGSGTLNLSGGGSTGRSFNILDGAVLNIDGALGLGNLSGVGAGKGDFIVGEAGEQGQIQVLGGALNVTGETFFGGNTTNFITLNNGGTFTTGSLQGAAGNIDLTDSASTLTITGAAGSSSFSAVIFGAGNLVLSGGSLTLNNSADSFSGTTMINGGSLTLGTGLELQNSTTYINTNNGLNLGSLTAASVGGLAGSGALNIGGTALTVGGNNSTTIYSGALSGSGILNKTGSGTQTLTGAGNVGQLNVTGGTLTIGNGGQLNAATGTMIDGPARANLVVDGAGSQLQVQTLQAGVNASGGLTVQNGGSLVSDLASLGINAGSSGSAMVTGTNSTWTTASLGLGGNIASPAPGGAGTLTVANGGIVNVTGATEFMSSQSSIVVNGGTFTTASLVSYAPGVGSINLMADPAGATGLNINAAGGTATYSGIIAGNGGLTKSGAGTQILAGANTFTGTTFVTGGTLKQLGGTSYSPVTVSAGATYQIGSGAYIAPLSSAGTMTAQAGGTIIYGAGATLAGGYLAGAGTHNAAGASFNGTTIDAGAAITFTAATSFNNVNNNGKVSTSTPLLTWNGGQIGASGTLDVNSFMDASGLNSYGVIQVANGGTLSSTGDLTLGGGSRTYVGSPASPGGTIDLTNGTLELDGGLLVNNGTINGTVDVNFGGLAEGAGSYGIVNVNQGGTFHAGNSPGEVTSQSANWNAGGAFQFDIINADGMPGDDWGLWTITGELNIAAGSSPNSQFTIDLETLTPAGAPGLLANFNPTQDYQWVFATAGSISGFALSDFAINAANFDDPLDGGQFYLSSNGQDVAIDFQAGATPEPPTWTLLLFALALGGLSRWRPTSGSSR